jgi:hypothetical protein
MDLNLLYAQHQGSLMSAAATTSRLARTKHLAAAGVFANRIRNHQLTTGAAAAAGWLRAVRKGERGDLR